MFALENLQYLTFKYGFLHGLAMLEVNSHQQAMVVVLLASTTLFYLIAFILFVNLYLISLSFLFYTIFKHTHTKFVFVIYYDSYYFFKVTKPVLLNKLKMRS